MLHVKFNARNEMIADALAAYPDECCGFLFGSDGEDIRFVKQIKVVNNAKEGDKRRRFEISPKDYMLAERYAEEQGLQLLGVYHSHPDHPAIPSEHDRIAAQPFFSYIILSVYRGEFKSLRSWQLNEQFFFEEEMINQYSLL